MLRRHSKRAHTFNNPTCTMCNKPFSRAAELQRHSKLHNLKEEDKIPCGFILENGRPCPKRFLQNGGRNVHYLTHTGVKPIPCTLCDKRFSDPSHYVRHKKEVHGYVPQSRKYLKTPGTTAVIESITRVKRRVRQTAGEIVSSPNLKSRLPSLSPSISSRSSSACPLSSPASPALATTPKPQDTGMYLRGLDYHPNGLNADEVAFVEEVMKSARVDAGPSLLGLALDNITPSIWDSAAPGRAFDNIGQLGNSLWNYTTSFSSPSAPPVSVSPSSGEVQLEYQSLGSNSRGINWFIRFDAGNVLL